MPIVWKGMGFFAVLLPLLFAFGAAGIAEQLSPGFNRSHGWLPASGLFASGLVLLPWGLYLNRGIPRLKSIVAFAGNHHFWAIRMEYWGAVFMIWGLAGLL